VKEVGVKLERLGVAVDGLNYESRRLFDTLFDLVRTTVQLAVSNPMALHRLLFV